MHWRDGQLRRARIVSGLSGEIRLRLPANDDFILRREADNKILSLRGKGKIKTFSAQAGKTYLLANNESRKQADSQAARR
jgi:hypothetical protein